LAIAADALFLIAFLFVIPQGSAVVFVLASIFCRHSDLSLSKAKNPRIRSLPLPVLLSQDDGIVISTKAHRQGTSFHQSAFARHRHFTKAHRQGTSFRPKRTEWRNLLLYPSLFEATVAPLSLPVLFQLRPPFLTSRPTPSLRLTYALRDSIG
jgi:hypothetical protein